jgi:hypothetical protein
MTTEEAKSDEVGNVECSESSKDDDSVGPLQTIFANLTTEFEHVSVDDVSPILDDNNGRRLNTLICDAGYGFPKEKRPKKEKVNAVASQLSNFLAWQIRQRESGGSREQMAEVRVVGCPDEATRSILENKIAENLKVTRLPSHLTLSCETLEEMLGTHDIGDSESSGPPVYLSPDADGSLDPLRRPPPNVVVGLLIDRRVQPNRSKERASKLNVTAKRWPLEECFVEISPNEPLNVDCVLEGMQQWWWNCSAMKPGGKEAFIHAASQAIERHARRHPSRPLHIEPGS